MNDVHNILVNLISNFIWAFIGALTIGMYYYARVRLPKRRLWRLTNPISLVICVSNTEKMDTGVYYRPATGIGELRALTVAVESLSRAYRRKLDIKNILLAGDPLHERYENDLLLLGGPKNNKVTAEYLKLQDVNGKIPVRLTSDAIIWRCKKKAGRWIDDGAIEYTSKAENKNVIQDYGIVIRMRSPFTTNKRTFILLSGIHTYGTIAAAKYFTEDMQRGWHWIFKLRKPNVAALVSTHIIDDYTVNIELIKFESW